MGTVGYLRDLVIPPAVTGTATPQVIAQVQNYYSMKQILPKDSADIVTVEYTSMPTDPQSGLQYEYSVTDTTTYQLCATFNKASNGDGTSIAVIEGQWNHPAGHFCFTETVVLPSTYPRPVPVK